MHQIAYFSTASATQDSTTVHDILIASRCNNRRDEITGLLVAGGNRYMQVIEGPEEAVRRLYATIRRDRRHLAVTTLLNRPIGTRAFLRWSMAYRREPALNHFDSFPQTLRYLIEQVGDSTLRRQIELFARTFIASPISDVPNPWDKTASAA